MKKIILTIVLIMSIGLLSMAQNGSDGFFKNTNTVNNRLNPELPEWTLPSLPSDYTLTGDQNIEEAPLGTGIFLLTALGAGYAISKRRKEER